MTYREGHKHLNSPDVLFGDCRKHTHHSSIQQTSSTVRTQHPMNHGRIQSPDWNFPWTASCTFLPTYSQGFSDVYKHKVLLVLPTDWILTLSQSSVLTKTWLYQGSLSFYFKFPSEVSLGTEVIRQGRVDTVTKRTLVPWEIRLEMTPESQETTSSLGFLLKSNKKSVYPFAETRSVPAAPS